MQCILISTEDLRLFRLFQVKDRSDWWATFSAEPTGEVYPFVTRGFTDTGDRVHLKSRSSKLSQIVDVYLAFRPSGGRFFINHRGAYFHVAERGPYDQFLSFELGSSPIYVPPRAFNNKR